MDLLPALSLWRFGLAAWLSAAAASAGQPQTPTGFASSRPTPAARDLALFDALCKALQDNYPMLELAGWHNEWVEEFRQKVSSAPSEEAALELMDELVCRLNDYHTRLTWPNRVRRASPPVRLEPVLASSRLASDAGIWGQVGPPVEMPPLTNVAVAVVEADPACGLQPGDEILGVEGVPVRAALAQAWRHSVCSSVAGKLRSAAGRMLSGDPDKPLQLRVRRLQAQSPVELAVAVRRTGELPQALLSSREVDGTTVIHISQFSSRPADELVSGFDRLLAQARRRPGLILDVRGNGGGEDDLAAQLVGRFLTQPIIASISFHRQVPGLTYERTVDRVLPRGPWRYEGRVAVLTDEGCMSATEHFVSGMIEAGAVACGTPTSGACGWIRLVELGNGVKLHVSQTFPLHTGGIPSPQLGIAPHLWAPRTLADLRAGHDTALRAALAWLDSGASPPPRQQPLGTFDRSQP